MTEEKQKISLMPLIVAAIIFAVPMGLIMGMNYMQQQQEISDLKQELADRELNFEYDDNYTNGWNDCINYLEWLRRPRNATMVALYN